MSENNINVGGRLHSIATGNVLAGSDEILDDALGKKQSQVNVETYAFVESVNNALASLSPEQQGALDVSEKANNNEVKLGYYVCQTEGNVAAKTIAAANYILGSGGSIKIKMNNANTADNATLNINSTGAKALYYAGERASATNSWEDGETVEVYYDGTSFYANNVAGGSGSGDGAFDISAKTGNNYETLNAALTVANSILSASKKKGGMSIKFIQLTPATYIVVKTEGVEEAPTGGTEVQESLSLESGTYTAAQMIGVTPPASGSVIYYLAVTVNETTTYTTWVITKATSDVQKYVQHRLRATVWTTNPYFWESYNDITTYDQQVADLDFSDEKGNVLIRASEGHIKTKNFDSSKDASEEERGLMSAEDKVALDESVEKLSAIEGGAQVNDVITNDNVENADLYLSDENDNVLAVFKNGGIKTKTFDSDNVKNISKFKGKSIGIIGDSISTFYGWLPSDITGYEGTAYDTYYPHGDVDSVELTWWYKLANMLGIATNKISNCSWSGSKVTGNSLATDTAAAGCSDRRIADLAARGFVPDIIICFISCNDFMHDIAIGSWQPEDGVPEEGTISTLREAYANMLNKIHTTYPLSRIFVCTILDDYRRDSDAKWPTNNGNGVSTYEWNKNIIEVADAFGCEIIDMHKCGINYQNIASNYAADTGLHPNKDGMQLMAEKAYNELITKY